MATAEEITALRSKLGESLGEGDDETSSLFSDVQVGIWVDSTTTMNGAALEGWQAKLAALSNLVNVTDGAASRELSDAFQNAMQMVKLYTKLAEGPAAGRSRIGRIVRT